MLSDVEKDGLPRYTPFDEGFAVNRRHRRNRRAAAKFIFVALLIYTFHAPSRSDRTHRNPEKQLLSVDRLAEDYATCAKLRTVAEDPSGPREQNARYNGSKSVLIKNATIWTGEPAAWAMQEEAHAGKGYAWIQSDVLLERGLIKRVEPDILESSLTHEFDVYHAHGRLLTSGIVDMHSHAGVDSLPDLRGNSDTNELSSDITPYVRSIDGLNPLDHQIQVIKSGGVTTSLILPGSGNNMGGEAYVIKHAVGRPDGRSEISAEDMLADPEKHWRYMKMACGENPKRVYGALGRDFGPFSRLGEAWYFRHAFEEATALVKAQDDWCAAADEIGAESMASYLPAELRWESLGALLRGQVLLNTHCYTIPDLEAFVKHTNEFKFKVRAFHHAHQTYLVPEILKRAYGGRPPAAALFADNMYYKAESYIGSEQAGKILYENGITPVYVSDNPVLNAQHVVFEAAKAYMNGLPYHAALAGVTTASAELLGLGERIGKVKAGFDADIVVWDSDPLSVGAAPIQVWIDGAPQFEEPVELTKVVSKPLVESAVIADIKSEVVQYSDMIFTGVAKILIPDLERDFALDDGSNVVIRNGTITCTGHCANDIQLAEAANIKTIQLENGYISPAMTAFGSFLGMTEIAGEKSTQNGDDEASSFSAAIDGLALDGKSLKAAYSRGVTRAISAPAFKNGGHLGVSAGFRIGALHALEKSAVFADKVAVHYTFTLAAKQGKTPSISSAIGELRTKLLKAITPSPDDKEQTFEQTQLEKVVAGKLPLVLTVHSADTIASLLSLKSDIEAAIAATSHSAPTPTLSLIIFGGAESHLLAPQLAASNVPVVLAPLLAYSTSWDQRRSLTGAPLTNGTAVDVLFAAGVKVAISTAEDWETRDLNLLAGIAHVNSGELISEIEALKMVSGNVYEMLGLREEKGGRGFVVYEGSPLEIMGRVRAVADRGVVSLWE